MTNDNQEKDWVKVLYEVILKILTLGFYHVEKNRRKWKVKSGRKRISSFALFLYNNIRKSTQKSVKMQKN